MTERNQQEGTGIYRELREKGTNPVWAALATPLIWLTVWIAGTFFMPEVPEDAKEDC